MRESLGETMRCDECFDCPKEMVEERPGYFVCPCCGASYRKPKYLDTPLSMSYSVSGTPPTPPVGLTPDEYIEEISEFTPEEWEQVKEILVYRPLRRLQLDQFGEFIDRYMAEFFKDSALPDRKAKDRARSKADLEKKRKEGRKKRGKRYEPPTKNRP